MQEEEGTTEYEIDGWHHQLNGREWIWASSGSWWWTGKPVVLQSMGSQIFRQDWATELTWVMIKVWAIYYVGSASQHISHFWTRKTIIFVLPAEVKVSQLPQRQHLYLANLGPIWVRPEYDPNNQLGGRVQEQYMINLYLPLWHSKPSSSLLPDSFLCLFPFLSTLAHTY